MKLLLLVAAFGLAAPAISGDKAAAPQADKKHCRHDAHAHAAKADRARQAQLAAGTFREASSKIAAEPMAPSLPPAG